MVHRDEIAPPHDAPVPRAGLTTQRVHAGRRRGLGFDDQDAFYLYGSMAGSMAGGVLLTA